jgi:uncharacterized membrane protein YphA (DoxX/SURF4 family)
MTTAIATPAANTSLANVDKKWMVWTGRILSAVPTLMLLMAASMKLSNNPQMVEMLSGKFGYVPGALFLIGGLELASAILYAIPRTAPLGAILVTGFLGGAIATHVRVGDFGGTFAPLALAVIAWAGLYARDKRLHALLPLRSSN